MKNAEQSLAFPESGIVLVDLSLKPIGSDSGAVRILRSHDVDGDETPIGIPDTILTAIKSRSPNDHAGMPMYFLIGKRKYRCRSYYVQSEKEGSDLGILAMHLDSDEDLADRIGPLGAEHGLTEREQEILRGLALGMSNKELADWMNISPNTVKSFARLIMIKLGVKTRAAIIGKLLDCLNCRPEGRDLKRARWER
jgi:DNA-binding CsgD family transcriptional regulator